ncbi:MAG: beta-propeller domain-containing protein [Ahniella sp.]|nr:beta-propeller domain-containing protein [Ahniella sp.]
MKRLLQHLFFLLLLSSLGTALAQTHVTAPEGRRVSEWWYDPAEPGWGLAVTHSGTQSVALLAGYDADGRDEWSVGVGPRTAQRLQANLVRTRWNPAAGELASQTTIGALDLVRVDEHTGTLRLTLRGVTTERQIRRILQTTASSVDDYSGLWLNPEKPGFGLSLLTQGPTLAVLATAYDESGEPRWWLGYKLSRPNDPAPFAARRYRRNCQPGNCVVVASDAGSMSIQPRHEREISALLDLKPGFEGGASSSFYDHAVYGNLGEPASGRERISDARPFHSEAALEDYFRLVQGAQPELPFECLDFSPLPPGAQAGPGGSLTNTQEAGIDEGDVLARSDDLVVHRALGTTFTQPAIRLGEFHLTRIRPEQAEAQTIRVLPLPEWQHAEQVLALPKQGTDHRFALLSSNRQNGFAPCCPAPVTVTPRTTITVVRIGADDSLRIDWQYTVEARPGVLRRNGETLLLLSNSSLLQVNDPASPVTRVHRPHWRIGQGAAQPLLRASNTWLGGFQPGTLGTTVVSVHHIPIAAPDQVRHFSMLQNQASMYATPDSVYLASNRTDPLRFGTDNQIMSYRTVTNIHKLSAADLSWRGSADVRGSIGAGNKSSWNLQEKGGDLRVVTTLRDRQADDPVSAALLTVLREDTASRRLFEHVRLPNASRPESLGHPLETVYGVRLRGDRLHLVTFRQIDPLYEVDLSNADDPRIVGELDVSGYSEYLHPLPDGRLLGFGYEVDPTSFVWFAPASLKLSLFDTVASGSPLQERQRFHFGGGNSRMPLLNEPHALASYAVNSQEIRLSTPMAISGIDSPWIFQPISVLRLRANQISGSITEARSIPADLPAGDLDDLGNARTVIYGEPVPVPRRCGLR